MPESQCKLSPPAVKRGIIIFLAGVLAGFAASRIGPVLSTLFGDSRIAPRPPSICYSCTFEGYDPKVREDLIAYYRQYFPKDQLLFADARFALWRATGTPNCDILKAYRDVAAQDPSAYRRYIALASLAFSGPECGLDTIHRLQAAAGAADRAGLPTEAALLRLMHRGEESLRFGDVEILRQIVAPAGAKSMVLGESAIQLTRGMRVGTQVDRVMRDWISAQLKWSVNDQPIAAPLIAYHEGALVKRMQELADVKVFALAGAPVARENEHWYAADDTGTFRFEVLDDKMRYPTSHATGDVGWIEDTHGISVLVPQALERKVQLVVGCGDSPGKMKAAFYLAEKGVNVFVPGDRYEDQLLGYQASGVIVGGAPIHKRGEEVVIGGQPVRFSLSETIVVEHTLKAFPMQYYDASARYFRRLRRDVPGLRLEFVEVEEPGQIGRVLDRADALRATAVAVRVMLTEEDAALRNWLRRDKERRAILFHSALYPFAQGLFQDFPEQVTFGDLHPRFE